MRWAIRIYAFILLGYAGWRTYDFLLTTLPKGDTSFFLALLFLFATEAGLVLWHEVSIRHTSTAEQHYISTGLTWVDFAGSLAAGTADMILRQTFVTGYTIPPLLVTILVYGLPIVVALNVAGVLFYTANDAETQLDRGKRELQFEINRQALKEMSENKSSIAQQMKGNIYQRLKNDALGKFGSSPRGAPMPFMPEPSSPPIAMQGALSPPGNGNGSEPVKINPTLPPKRGRPTMFKSK